MIGLATTPPPAAAQGGQAGGGSPERGGAPGFADLVQRQGAGRSAPAADDARPAESGASEADGGSEAGEQADAADETAGEPASSWPARGLHKVLATLFGDRGAPAEDEAGKPSDAPEAALAEAVATPQEAPLSPQGVDASDEDAAADGGEAGPGAEEDDPDDAAGMAAAAVAIVLPPPPRDQRQPAANGARPAEQPATTTSAVPSAAGSDQPSGQDDGSPSGGDRRGEAAADVPKGRHAAPEAGDMKLRVIAETVLPSPGPSQTQRTIADLAATIASDGDWTSAMERASASRAEAASTPAGPIRDLRIQLNPAELGTVDARLRIVGEQLSVEIRVESGEAYRRLSSEREAILAALRGLGFAVDDVSIQQQAPASGQSQGNAGSRQGDTLGGQSQGPGREQQSEGGSPGGRQRGEEQGGQNGDARTPATRPAGGGLYI